MEAVTAAVRVGGKVVEGMEAVRAAVRVVVMAEAMAAVMAVVTVVEVTEEAETAVEAKAAVVTEEARAVARAVVTAAVQCQGKRRTAERSGRNQQRSKGRQSPSGRIRLYPQLVHQLPSWRSCSRRCVWEGSSRCPRPIATHRRTAFRRSKRGL